MFLPSNTTGLHFKTGFYLLHWCVQPPNLTGCTCATVCKRVQPPCYALCAPYYKKRRIHSMRAQLDNALQITQNTSKDASSFIGITCHHHNGTPFQGVVVAPRAPSVPAMHSCSIQYHSVPHTNA